MADKIGSVMDGKYEVVRLVGEGGMGAVYEAKHRLIGRRLAIKFLHPQYSSVDEVVERFHREARAAASIGHDHIIEVTDMGMSTADEPYIVMEYLDGFDLKETLKTGGPMSEGRAAFIMVQALSALHAAHEAGIIHRDLKPDNIFLTQKGELEDFVKVLDFGVSKFRDLGASDHGLTQTGTVLGTPSYMSPEQARGRQDLTLQADVYAMGVILYKILSGKLPYEANNYNSLLVKIITEEPTPIQEHRPDLSAEMVAVVNKAMAKELPERFQDCIQFREFLLPFAPEARALLASSLGTGIHDIEILRASTEAWTPLATDLTGQRAIGTPKKSTRMSFFFALLFVLSALIALVKADVIDLRPWQDKISPDTQEILPGWFFSLFDLDAPGSQVPSVELAGASGTPAPVQDTDIQQLQDTDSETGDTELAAGTDSKARTFELNITVVPQNAVIKIDGVEVTDNPFIGLFPADGAMRKIEISAEGYKPKAELVPFTEDTTLEYELEKEAPKKKASRRWRPKKKKSSKPQKRAPKKRRTIDDADPWQ